MRCRFGLFLFVGFLLVGCAGAEEPRVFFPDKRDNIEEWCKKSKIVYCPQGNNSTYDYCHWFHIEINKLREQEEKMGLGMVVYGGVKEQKYPAENRLPSSPVTQTVFSALNRIAIEFETIVTYTNGLFLIGRRVEYPALTNRTDIGKDPFSAISADGGSSGM